MQLIAVAAMRTGRERHFKAVVESAVDFAIIATDQCCLTEGRAIDERWHMHQDGTRFWASGEMMPLNDEAEVTSAS